MGFTIALAFVLASLVVCLALIVGAFLLSPGVTVATTVGVVCAVRRGSRR